MPSGTTFNFQFFEHWKSNGLQRQDNGLQGRWVVLVGVPRCCNLAATKAQAKTILAWVAERAQALGQIASIGTMGGGALIVSRQFHIIT